MMCPVCRGRGEVEAGVTYGRPCGWVDDSGQPGGEAIRVEVNPSAWDRENKTIWFLDYNSTLPLWSTAICMVCRGTGEAHEKDRK